jgi:hypothetical protein
MSPQSHIKGQEKQKIGTMNQKSTLAMLGRNADLSPITSVSGGESSPQRAIGEKSQ